jgi:hypothetical protein
LTLFNRESRVARLGHGRAKNVQAADVLVLRRNAAKRFIQSPGISPGELRDAAHAQDLEIAKHGGADRAKSESWRESERINNLLDTRLSWI